ncbi:hypothetical protein B0T13DRAFT_231029 [Neurospora crassa]|nr:hypothetical protein B0T13DRAFT_231029 [Neurospora crassa]
MEKPRRRVRAQHRQRHSETTPDPDSAQPLFNKDPTRHDNTTDTNSYGDARYGYARRVRIARATSIICVNNNGMVYLRTQQRRRREEEKSVDVGGGKHNYWDKEGIGISTG